MPPHLCADMSTTNCLFALSVCAFVCLCDCRNWYGTSPAGWKRWADETTADQPKTALVAIATYAQLNSSCTNNSSCRITGIVFTDQIKSPSTGRNHITLLRFETKPSCDVYWPHCLRFLFALPKSVYLHSRNNSTSMHNDGNSRRFHVCSWVPSLGYTPKWNPQLTHTQNESTHRIVYGAHINAQTIEHPIAACEPFRCANYTRNRAASEQLLFACTRLTCTTLRMSILHTTRT